MIRRGRHKQRAAASVRVVTARSSHRTPHLREYRARASVREGFQLSQHFVATIR